MPADSVPSLETLPDALQAEVLAAVPAANVLSLFETSKACRRAVHEYNAQAATDLISKVKVEDALLEPSETPVRNGSSPLRVELPPAEHLVSSVAMLDWAQAHGWTRELTCSLAARGGSVAVLELAMGQGGGRGGSKGREEGRGAQVIAYTCWQGS